MNRYRKGLEEGLKRNNIEYEVIAPEGSGLFTKYVRYSLMAWSNRKKKGKHIIISERYAYLLHFLTGDTIVICHDLHTLYAEANTAGIHKKLYRFFLKSMLKAKKTVCVSEHTKADLEHYCSRFKGSSRLKVVHNGIEEFWLQEQLPNHIPDWGELFETHRVLLSVGTDAWYKNNAWSLHLLSILPLEFHLIRVGKFAEKNQKLINELNLSERITELDKLSDSDLKFAYTNAEALLFPSITEGFGWPALEAALCSCAVITGGKGATAEIFPGNQGLISLENASEELRTTDHPISVPDYILWKDQVKELIV